MRADSERDIKKSEKRRELPREERGRRAERCRDGGGRGSKRRKMAGCSRCWALHRGTVPARWVGGVEVNGDEKYGIIK